MTTLAELPELALPREVAAFMRVGLGSVYAAIAQDVHPMPSIKLGPHQTRIPRQALARWLGIDADSAQLPDTASGVKAAT